MWLSALLLGSVVDFMAEQLKSRVEDGLNSQSVTQQVNYQGESIQFSHKLWRIESASICADKLAEPQALSRCQLAAQALFRQRCEVLGRERPGGDDPTLGSQRAMYCAALHDGFPAKNLKAQSQPTTSPMTVDAGQAQVASVTGAAPTESRSPAKQLEEQLRQCKRLTVLAWISKEASRQAERDQACGRYEQSKRLSLSDQKR